MDHLVKELQTLVSAMQYNLLFLLKIIAIVWLINIVNWVLLGSRLNILGIYPRNIFGLIGIPCSPILHGHFNHLFFNTFPLLVLASLVMLKGTHPFFVITVMIIVGSGLLTWLIGRKALHIGASSLIMGYWGFLLVQATQERTIMALVLGAVSLYYFGGLLMSLFPDEQDVSWEGHLSGVIAGVATFYLYPYLM